MRGRQDFDWILDSRGVSRLAERLSDESRIALDTEANSGFAYRERLCLLQIAAGQELWLIDLLALPGGRSALDPLRPVLEDSARIKFLHGGEFDVGCLKRDYGFAPRGVFDSQQAATFLGWERTGYGAVVERICGVELPKEHTRYDWGRRPIDAEAISYAVNDVRYLLRVGRFLEKEVTAADLMEEVQIASAAVEEATWNGGADPDDIWAIKGVRRLPPSALPLLVALSRWRDRVARELDLPPGRALNNHLLLALSKNPPNSAGELRRRGLPKRIDSDLQRELLEVIRGASTTPPLVPTVPGRSRRVSRSEQLRGQRLKSWRREEAERRGVPLPVVLPTAALRHLQQHGAGGLQAVPQLGSKRIGLYREALVRLCEE